MCTVGLRFHASSWVTPQGSWARPYFCIIFCSLQSGKLMWHLINNGCKSQKLKIHFIDATPDIKNWVFDMKMENKKHWKLQLIPFEWMFKIKCQQSCIFLNGIDRGDSVYGMSYMYLFISCLNRQRPGWGRKNRGLCRSLFDMCTIKILCCFKFVRLKCVCVM